MLSISRRVDAARRAFDRKDVEAGRRLHDPDFISRAVQDDERRRTSWFGAYIGSMVYGALDGIVTTFAVVSGVAGANLSSNIILILGIGNLLADGFSMGVGDFLSTKSEREYYDREARRQRWEIESFPEGQRAELHALYLKDGWRSGDAEQLVELHTHDTDRWVNAMMIEELGMLKEDHNPLYNALTTFLAFVIAGSVPLGVYLVGLVVPIEADVAFHWSLALSGVALFLVGAAKVFVTRLNPLRSGLEMLLVGGLAAGVAYLIGDLLQHVGG
ncbi:MAG TPA: VIT1/CCC1 transporter family protein [Longimicrobiales bacterium]